MIDVFRIGVHLGMSSNEGQVLGALSQHLLHVHAQAKELEGQFNRVKLAVGGAVAVMGGVALAKGVWHTVEAAKELNSELNRTARLGGNLAIDPAVLRAQAYKISNQVRTMDPAGVVKLEREIAGQVNDHNKAFEITPFAAKLAWTLEQYTGVNADTAVRDAVKASDLWGHIFTAKDKNGNESVDVAKLTAAMDMFSKGVVASGGLLKMSDYVAFMKQAGLSGKNMTPEGIAWMTEAMIAMGPSRAGTASSSLFQQFQAGVAPGYDWKNLAKDSGGAFKEGRDFVVGKGGHTTITDQGRKDLHVDDMKNQAKWVNDILIPMLEKGGVKEQDILTELTRILGRQTTQRLVGEAYQNKTQFARTADVAMHSKGTEESFAMLEEKDLGTNIKELEEAWKGFTTALGENGIPLAIQALHGLTEGIHRMTDWVNANPEAATRLLEFAAGLSAIMVVLGGAAVVAAIATLVGTGGLLAVAAGITALGVAIFGMPDWLKHFLGVPVAGEMKQTVIPGAYDTMDPGMASIMLTGSDTPAGRIKAQMTGMTGKPEGGPLHAVDYDHNSPEGKIKDALLGIIPPLTPVVPPPPPSGIQSGNSNDPQKVYVVNGRDMTRGIVGGMTDAASRAPNTSSGSLDRQSTLYPSTGGSQ